MGTAPAPKSYISKLPDGVQLVKGTIFWHEGPWYFVRGEMVWSKKEGWKHYSEGNRDDCYFNSAEEAMEAWKNSER